MHATHHNHGSNVPCSQSRARLLLCWLALAVSGSATEVEVFSYTNPISDGLDPHGVRDCTVFREDSKWYMTGTAWPHWARQEKFGVLNPGVMLYSSDDLKRWSFERIVISRPTSDKWYLERFWAPEIKKFRGKYYATFNCSNPTRGYPGQHFGYAVADNLTGPYRVVTEEKPLGPGNDLSLFEDDDGKVWAFWNRGPEFGIGFAELDLEKGVLLTKPQTAILPGPIDYARKPDGSPVMEPGYDGRLVRKIERCHDWDSIGIEGAFVVKHKGRYLLFYSSWTRGYEIGTASADKITGPWTKNPQNPIYGAQSKTACEKAKLPYTGELSIPFDQVGHNAVFTGPDGNLWLSCHGILKSKPEQPMLVIDPIRFSEEGNPIKSNPTHEPQVIALPLSQPQ